MMRILHILESAKIGGISNIVYDLLKSQELNKDLFPELLICRNSEGTEDRFIKGGITFHKAGLSGGFDIAIKKYVFIIRLFKNFQILHFHSYNHFIFLCAILSGTKIVYSVHSLLMAPGRIHKRSDIIKDIILNFFFHHFCHHLVFNSRFTQEYYFNRYGLKKRNFSIVYNGVDLNNFNSLKYFNKKNKFTVGTVCSLVKLKRIDVLIRAFSRASIPDSRLIIVGDGPQMNPLLQLVQSLGIEDHVQFAGNQINPALYYQQFDLFVSSSVYESFGLVAIEALSFGLPVITMSDGGGITEIIKSIEPGNIVDDFIELSDRINYFFMNPNKISEKKQDRIDYANKFSISSMESQIHSIYSLILGNIISE